MEMKNKFVAHWCVPRKSRPKWRPYDSLVCSYCIGENGGSVNMSFPNTEAYKRTVERGKEMDLVDDGWRN